MAEILILDDDALVAQSMRHALKTEHAIDLSQSPADSLAFLQLGKRYAAILCDLSMPGFSGIQFYDAVRALDPHQAQRIIFVSGGAYLEEIQNRLEALNNVLLNKPFTFDQLRQTVRRVAAA
jgi:CheY-like chemotaxis protein